MVSIHFEHFQIIGFINKLIQIYNKVLMYVCFMFVCILVLSPYLYDSRYSFIRYCSTHVLSLTSQLAFSSDQSVVRSQLILKYFLESFSLIHCP